MNNKYLPYCSGLAWHKPTQSLVNLSDLPIHKDEFRKFKSSQKTRSWSNVGTQEQYNSQKKLFEECKLHSEPCEYILPIMVYKMDGTLDPLIVNSFDEVEFPIKLYYSYPELIEYFDNSLSDIIYSQEDGENNSVILFFLEIFNKINNMSPKYQRLFFRHIEKKWLNIIDHKILFNLMSDLINEGYYIKCGRRFSLAKKVIERWKLEYPDDNNFLKRTIKTLNKLTDDYKLKGNECSIINITYPANSNDELLLLENIESPNTIFELNVYKMINDNVGVYLQNNSDFKVIFKNDKTFYIKLYNSITLPCNISIKLWNGNRNSNLELLGMAF